jgi:hypothetical protein
MNIRTTSTFLRFVQVDASLAPEVFIDAARVKAG